MTEKRACFDFEIDFSNGGGIQGQGFRLDIDGDDITDDALAAYIIRDLNLLMVGEARILNKAIIEESHKRKTPASTGGIIKMDGIQIDLSHKIENGMTTYKGLPGPIICDHLSFAESRTFYAEGTEFQIGRIDMVSNTGTYIDTPYHRYPEAPDLCGLPLHRVSDVPGIVVRLAGMNTRAIDWMAFAATDVTGKAVLIHTGWSAHWGTERYFDGHPYLTESAAEFLRDRGAILVGIDSLNIDDTSGNTRPVHSVLLADGIPIVEHLTNLDTLPNSGFRFSAVPPKIQGMGTFPVRAHARLVGKAGSDGTPTVPLLGKDR